MGKINYRCSPGPPPLYRVLLAAECWRSVYAKSATSAGDGELLFEALLFVEAGIVAISGEKFVVGAELDDASADEDGDAVGIADRGDAVGDEDGGAAFHAAAQLFEDALLGVGIDAGQGVVEDEDARVADQGAGKGGALLLTSGEGEAAFADEGLEAAGEVFEFLADVGGFGGVEHLFAAGVGGSEEDVLADGLAEEEGLLGDESDVGAEAVEGIFAYGMAVDEDGSGRRRRRGAG